MSQFGRPKLVGVCRPVIASEASLFSMMFWASAAEILAVRYYENISWCSDEADGQNDLLRGSRSCVLGLVLRWLEGET